LIEFSDRGWEAVRTALKVADDLEAELGARIGVAKLRQLPRPLEAIANS